MHYFYWLVIAQYYVLAVLCLCHGCMIIGWDRAVPWLIANKGGVAPAVLPTTHSSYEETVEYYNVVMCLYAIIGLKEELPAYLAEVADISPSFSPLEWWKMHSAELPIWSAAASKVLLVQPSSAVSERVFSLLNASFGDQQECAFQDYLEYLYNVSALSLINVASQQSECFQLCVFFPFPNGFLLCSGLHQ